MGLVLSDVLDDYVASLNDAASVFGAPDDPSDVSRHLQVAATRLATEKRPRMVTASITVSAGQALYDGVPADLLHVAASQWGLDSALSIWDRPSGRMPKVYLQEDSSGRVLFLSPAPTAAQIAAYGAAFRYIYAASHELGADAASNALTAADKPILILRAQVEAAREMSIRGIYKPTRLGQGASTGTPANMSPTALYQKLLAEYEKAA